MDRHWNTTIKSVSKCQKQSLDYFDMINQFLEVTTERSTTMTSLKNAGRRGSTTLRSGYLNIGYQNWQWEDERRKDSNIVWIQTPPINSCTFEQFKDVQEKVLLILHCKTNTLIPKGFTEHLYHVGNANDLNSFITNGFIPGRMSLKRGRQAVFFTTVNPMEDGYGLGETPCDLTKPKIMPYKNTWKRFQNTVFWCNLKLAQEKGLHFYQTRSDAVVLYNTLPPACVEKAVCTEKTTDELYQKGTLNSESATSCVKIELAALSARPTKPRRKIIHLGNHQVSRTVSVKPVTAPWTTE